LENILFPFPESRKRANSKLEKVLAMMYSTQNYLGFGLFPSSGVLGSKHDISETGSVSILPRTPDEGKSPKPR
jgi:hypothetical protein